MKIIVKTLYMLVCLQPAKLSKEQNEIQLDWNKSLDLLFLEDSRSELHAQSRPAQARLGGWV